MIQSENMKAGEFADLTPGGRLFHNLGPGQHSPLTFHFLALSGVQLAGLALQTRGAEQGCRA